MGLLGVLHRKAGAGNERSLGFGSDCERDCLSCWRLLILRESAMLKTHGFDRVLCLRAEDEGAQQF